MMGLGKRTHLALFPQHINRIMEGNYGEYNFIILTIKLYMYIT